MKLFALPPHPPHGNSRHLPVLGNYGGGWTRRIAQSRFEQEGLPAGLDMKDCLVAGGTWARNSSEATFLDMGLGLAVTYTSPATPASSSS